MLYLNYLIENGKIYYRGSYKTINRARCYGKKDYNKYKEKEPYFLHPVISKYIITFNDKVIEEL